MRFYIEKLGCPKNDTDAEGIAQLLIEAGYKPAINADKADVIIVNTCGFIDAAREESFQCLQQYARRKRRLRVRKVAHRYQAKALIGNAMCLEKQPAQPVLIAAGCLSERYRGELARLMPELDGIVGTQRWAEIPQVLEDILRGQRPSCVGKGPAVTSVSRTASGPTAYVKIADGCSVGCAFCAIPRIKGPHRSKPLPHVVAEVRQLVDSGAREIILIAQNTAAYGHDWGEQDGLATLLQRIVERVPEIPWIRIMYAYPEHITDRLIETIARNDQVVKYLDVPLQHAHPDVLRRMRRPAEDARPLIRRLREAIPEIALRSAFIVGYPGEDEKEFQALLSFLDEVELDRVGVFKFSAEEGTLAASLPGQLNSRAKLRREDRAMRLLREISARKTKRLLGSVLDVLVEGTAELGGNGYSQARVHPIPRVKQVESGSESHTEALKLLSVGRSYRDAPEVDGLVFLKERVPVGSLVRARVIGASEYDLFAEIDGSDLG